MDLSIALLGLIIIVGLSSINWRRSVKAALVIVILEGVLRKWVLPQASDFIYFVKDLVLLGAYLKYYFSSEPKYPFKSSGFTITLLMVIGWCLAQSFNPSLGSPIVGFFGLKAYIFYIPLMWMLPSLFQSEEELYRFLRNYMLLVIPVALLAVAQFGSPSSSPINMYVGGQEATATAGGAVRVTGTFPYIAGYSVYLSTCFSLLIPLLTLPQTPLWRSLTVIEILLVIGTSFMTGARGLLFFEILFVVGYICILWFTQPSIAARSTKQFMLPVVLISAIVPMFFNKAIEAFSSRVAGSDSETFLDRAFSAFAEPENAMQFKGFDSYGTGATHQAVPALRQALNLPWGESPPPAEGEMGRVVLEIGPFGFLIWYGLRLALIFSLARVYLKLKTPFFRNLALAIFLFHAINITNQLVVNSTFAIYYWFFGGFVFLLPTLESQQLFSSKHWVQQPHV
ncbi:MAG: hypothetical protein KME32_08895 [Mojavia pulchra JT2-VF2]|jgi:hypothetical protein|uniref:Uncharacterized protein n=1 Tax=Mojavia pulchra JT2-VF2 TaxID=287848 RepID=A0A951PWS4_9NOST|nr:hypothetical protein [Mojavia pulchra JT2-VF2]